MSADVTKEIWAHRAAHRGLQNAIAACAAFVVVPVAAFIGVGADGRAATPRCDAPQES